MKTSAHRRADASTHRSLDTASHTRFPLLSRVLVLLAFAGLAMSGPVAMGATFYWDTNDATAGSAAATGTWNSAGSTAWSTDSTGSTAVGTVTTANTDDLFIAAGTNGTAGTITVSGAVLANSITFDDAVDVTISGGTSITLGGGGGSGTGIFQTANGANVISTGVILGASSTAFAFSNSSTSLLTIGAVTGAATSGTQTITVGSTSTGGITLNGIIGNGAAGGNVALAVNNTGSGVTTLTGLNTFSGGLTVSQGVVSIAANTALGGAAGTAGAVTLDGGTLRITGSGGMVNTHAITIGANGGAINNLRTSTFIFNTANTLLGSGALTITGSGSLLTTGVGVVVLNTAQTYNGNVILQDGGILEYANGSGLASGAPVTLNNNGSVSATAVTVVNAVTVNAGGVLAFQNNNGGNFAGNITLNGAATVKLQNWYNTTSIQGIISGNISGAGGLTISNNAATLTLLGANTYTGNTVIGTGATLIDVEPVARTYTGVISGSGAFIKAGLATLTLTNTNLHSGATTIRGGTLQVGDGTSGSLASTTTLAFGGTGTFNYQGVSTGSSQSLGATTFSAGAGTVQSTYGTSGNTALTLANVVARTAGATGNFVVSGGTNGTTNKIVFTQVAGVAPAAGALLDKGYYFNGADFAAYDVGGFVRALAYGTDTNAAAPDTITAANHVKLTATPANQNSLSILTLNLAGSGVSYTQNASQTLTLSGGGVIKSGGGTVGTISGGTAITTGGATELVVRTDAADDLLTISTPFTGSTGGLTKTGLGTLTLSGTGNSYTGATTIDAGTLTLSGTYTGGSAFTVRNTGTLNINGASNGNIIVAPATGVGIANVNAAVTLPNGNTLSVGSAGGVGVLNVAANISGGDRAFEVGTGGVGSLGVANVTAGTITLARFLVAGNNNGSSGIWNIAGGAVTTTGNNGGTLGIGGASAFNTGVLNIASGSYSSVNNTANSLSGIYVGENANGTGILNVSGTGVANLGGIASAVALNIGRINGATGIVNLGAVLNGGSGGSGGGTINTFRVQKSGGTATGIFNFHGGTLQASIGANSTFMTGLTAAYVYGEGGTVDNNAQAITIGQALLAPTGSGVTSLTLGGTTTGFTPGATPLVTITGGGGTGATAIANVDGSGNLTLTITNPGTGYTSIPLVTLTGGTSLGTTTVTAALGANSSGGLIFQGSNTTTLTGTSTYTGGTTITAGTLALGHATDTLANAGAINVNGGTLGIGTNTDTVGAVTLTTGTISGTTGVLSGSSYDVRSGTVSGILGGTGSTLTKTTAGTVTVSSVNTYTGATTVNAGTLTLSGAGSINNSSGITINGSGAKLVQTSSVAGTPAIALTQGTLDGTGTVGAVTVGNGTGGIVTNGNGTTATLTLGSLTFSGAGTISLRKVDDTSTAALAVTNALTTTPANGLVTLNVLTGPIWANGSTYNLISYGSFGGANTDFTTGSIVGLGARQSATIGNTGAGSGFITLAIAGDTPVWTGLVSGAWTTTAIGGSQNWKLQTAGTGTEFLTNDQVLFDDTAAGTTAVTINDATVSPVSVVFNNSTKNYTLSGSNGITSGTLAKNGTGTVTISTANTYAGETNINGGTLIAGNGAALGSVAAGTMVASGATLDINSQNLSTEVLTISGSGVGGNGALVNNGAGDQINATGRIILAADATIGGTRRWDLRNSTPTLNMGGFTLAKTGTNLVSLVGVGVSNAGHIVINQGRLNIETTTNLGGSSANTITVNSGATLGFWSATVPVAWSVALNDATILQENGSSTISGPVTLTGANTINVSGTSHTISGAVSGAGSLTKTGGNVMTVSKLTNSYSGGTVVSAGRLAYDAGGTAGATGNITPFGTGSVTVNSGAQLRLGTNVGGHNNSVFNIANAVTLDGGIVYAEDGIQHLTGTVAVGAGGGTLGSTYNNSGADINKGLFLDGIVSGSGNLTLQQSGIGTGQNYNTSIVYFTNNSNTYSGTIAVTPMGAGNGGGSYVGINATSALANATVNLSGNNTSNAQQFGTSLIVFNTGLGTATIGALSGSGNVVLTGYNQSTHAYGADSIALNVGGNDASTTYSGVISGGGSLTKSGAGTMTVSGVSTYSGATIVSAGTLEVTGQLSGTSSTTVSGGVFLANNSTGSATGSGNVTVQSGARLGGNGLVGLVTGTQNITVNSGGILGIGNSADIVGDDLDLKTSGVGVIMFNGTLEFDIYDNLGGTDNLTNPLAANDLLNLTSDTSIVLGGTLKVTDTTGISNTSWVAGDTWKLIDWTSVSHATRFTGAFATFDLPALNSGLGWTTSTDSTGYYLSIVVVPEPSRLLLLAGGLMFLLLRRRRVS